MRIVNKMNIMSRRLLLLCLITLFSVWSNTSFAIDCSQLRSTYTWTVDISAVVHTEPAVGGTFNWVYPKGSSTGDMHMYLCPTSFSMAYQGGVPASIGNHTYKTNLKGVGIRMVTMSGAGSFSIYDEIYFENPENIYEVNTVTNLIPSHVSVFLVKTDEDYEAGELEPGLIGSIKPVSNTYGVNIVLGSGSVTAPGCSVLTKTVNVNLGTFLTTEFTGVGSKTGPVSVPIKLSCPMHTSVHATVTADPDSDTTEPGVIKLNPSSGSASGVGIQLSDANNNGIVLNQESTTTAATTGEYDLLWSANYIQTKSEVTPGDANASATLTLTYN